jgi:probable HAF family extracellular repeat protein
MAKQRLISTAAALFIVTLALQAGAAQFIPLGDFPEGAFHSLAQAISADGTTVVGAGSGDSGSSALRWRQETGTVNLETLPLIVPRTTFAHGVSGNGSIVVGSIRNNDDPRIGEAFRWSAADGIVGLGYLPGAPASESGAADVSSDGSVIVGYSGSSASINGSHEAFRWTKDTGMVGLGELPGGNYFSTATGISARGDVIVGISHSEFGSEPFRWTEATGMIPLGDLPGGIFNSGAEAVSSDGSVIVGSGFSELSGTLVEAFRWSEHDGMQPLGDLAGGDFWSQAFAVSSDGAVVLGISHREEGIRAFAWDERHGMRDLREVLISHFSLGPQLADWKLIFVGDISDDGLSIVGHGINPAGNREGWLVRLDRPLNVPEPATIALLLWGATSLLPWRGLRGRLRSIAVRRGVS